MKVCVCVCVHWCCAANRQNEGEKKKKKDKRVLTSAAFLATRVPGQFRPLLPCITLAIQTWDRVQNTRLLALTLSIYYGYIVQANSLRANRHVVLNTESSTEGRKVDKQNVGKRRGNSRPDWECGRGEKTAKVVTLPPGGWRAANTTWVVLGSETLLTAVSPVTRHVIVSAAEVQMASVLRSRMRLKCCDTAYHQQQITK